MQMVQNQMMQNQMMHSRAVTQTPLLLNMVHRQITKACPYFRLFTSKIFCEKYHFFFKHLKLTSQIYVFMIDLFIPFFIEIFHDSPFNFIN